MARVIFAVFLLINSVFSSVPRECFERHTSFIVYRDGRKLISEFAHTVNNEKYTSEIIAEKQDMPVLQTGCIKKLPNLQYITLNECGIQNIEKSAFLELPKLRSISIIFNNIKVIRNGVFHSLGISKLLLTGNGIEEVEQQAFYNLSSLEILDLSRNNLYSLKPDIFFKTNNLRQINLSNNKLLFVYDFFFWDCFDASESYDSLIDLSSNNISEIERNAFKGVYYINSLLLNDNNIKKINPNVFQELIQGKTLDLRGNLLQKMPNKILFGKFDEVLYIEELPEDDFVIDIINNRELSEFNGTEEAKNTTTFV